MKLTEKMIVLIPDKIPYPFDYDAPWWLDYSRWVREQKNWRCDDCDISLKDNYEMLHTSRQRDKSEHTSGSASIMHRLPCRAAR